MRTSTDKDNVVGLLWKSIDERHEFKTVNGEKFEFIDYWPNVCQVRAWRYKRVDERKGILIVDKTDLTSEMISIKQIPVDELKTLGIFDILTDEMKKVIEELSISDTVDMSNAMDHARKHRKSNPEFLNLPRSIKCIQCGKEQKIAPAVLIKRAILRKVKPEDFHTIFVCLECDPTQRGRKASAKYLNMAKELHCQHEGCKISKKQHPSLTEKAAGAVGITFTEYVNTWKCKEHRDKKIHHFTAKKNARLAQEKKDGIIPNVPKIKNSTGEVKRRGKQASGKYVGLTGEIHCSEDGCDFIQKQHPSLTIKAAENKGITFDEFVKGWKCKKHREKKGKKVKEIV